MCTYDMADVLEYLHMSWNIQIFLWYGSILRHVKKILSTLGEHVKKIPFDIL
jgi:hypothetical protein